MNAVPKLLRFKELKARGVVSSWPQLARMVEGQDFPRGIYLSPAVRVWPEPDVVRWLEARGMRAKDTEAA